ncbi:ABC transporter ATP-binding protein [Aquabacterium sp. OR-4]|uniref:ABC transporter ATP-binding protein n=1 Tax=Aquabacterium sp. OR-4 TaxID=2978127 RepID=UPI0021B4B657|nr:sn-glycerol-3-phosphate ABC transporter ATP-binding protein UgpC [Aquabacterium sp. OR-4]MDT7834215.1 sn-glycerol-3-phosphate ABC transporter ATP-binding protein UgpC [Aquabacterium sp. OR-4]
MADVRLVNVQKSYGDTHVLRDVNLEVRDGEFMVFVGPSGCGKSTLLRTIAGLEDISGGELSIGGRLVNEVPPAERGIAMVFQSYALYPHMDLYENMAFGLQLAKVPKAEIDTAVHNAAKILHIEHLLKRKPKDLSGGQRQRVAIGRAIVRKPEVFLFDEPLSNLDAALRVKMRYEFAKLHDELKTTMIYVTHDQVEAMTLADRIVVLSAGRIEQVGSPLALYEHPDNLFVAGFIGSPKMNLIGAELVAVVAGEATVKLPDGSLIRARVDATRAKAGDKVTLGIRPEHLGAAEGGSDGNTIDARITFVESLGSSTQAYSHFAGAEDDTLTCQLDGRLRPRQGDAMPLWLPPEACYLFDAQGLAFRRLVQATPAAGLRPAVAA